MQVNDLLNEKISAVSWSLFEKGYFREAMINSILCLFDTIREESGLQNDGANLITNAFSIENPRIILADLQSESGKNIQKGTIQILQGYFQAYRNVGSHSLNARFQEKDVLSVLIAVSRLYEQIWSAEKAVFLRHDGLYYHADEECNRYFRFYEDGVVIAVPTIGEHKDVINWFNRENAEDFKHFSIGRYKTDERIVGFCMESPYGKVDYQAIIRPNLLHVKSHSHINENKSEDDYVFISWNSIKA